MTLARKVYKAMKKGEVYTTQDLYLKVDGDARMAINQLDIPFDNTNPNWWAEAAQQLPEEDQEWILPLVSQTPDKAFAAVINALKTVRKFGYAACTYVDVPGGWFTNAVTKRRYWAKGYREWQHWRTK